MYYTPKKLFRILCLRLARYIPMSGYSRCKLVRMGGVSVKEVQSRSTIGEGCVLDTVHPERIIIGHHVCIGPNCIIITHLLDPSKPGRQFCPGSVIFEDDCFVGAGSIICNDVIIGKNAIVGAGSIVTKNIPDNEVWAGNPAHFIKKR